MLTQSTIGDSGVGDSSGIPSQHENEQVSSCIVSILDYNEVMSK